MSASYPRTISELCRGHLLSVFLFWSRSLAGEVGLWSAIVLLGCEEGERGARQWHPKRAGGLGWRAGPTSRRPVHRSQRTITRRCARGGQRRRACTITVQDLLTHLVPSFKAASPPGADSISLQHRQQVSPQCRSGAPRLLCVVVGTSKHRLNQKKGPISERRLSSVRRPSTQPRTNHALLASTSQHSKSFVPPFLKKDHPQWQSRNNMQDLPSSREDT